MIDETNGNSSDPTRGAGSDKETQAEPTGFEAPPGAFDQESAGSATPDAARGGCLKFGWGCLPIVAGLIVAIPAGLFY